MAALALDASSSSEEAYSDTESSTSNCGDLGDEPVHFTYSNGALVAGSLQLNDEDVITVANIPGSGTVHSVFSLAPAPAAPEPEAEIKEHPFELRTINSALLPPDFLDRHLFRALPAHFNASNELRILISTLSGTGLAPDFFDEVLHPLLKAIGLPDSRYNVVRTTTPESVIEFARSTLLVGANQGRKQTVLMLSGDGGVVDTLNGLLDSGNRSSIYVPPILTQLPLGTGNALFHSLHRPSQIPSIYVQGLRTLLHGTPRPLPIFQATFSPGARLVTNEGQTATPLPNNALYGAVVASYGLHATLVADSDTTEYRKHGDKRFGLVAKDLLFPEDGSSPHAYKSNATLVKDGQGGTIHMGEHGYVLASLVSNLEKTFTISPASKPLDGQLRVVRFGALDGEKTMDIMRAAYADGKHVAMDGVGYTSVDSLRIQFLEKGESWKWRRCCIDGLVVGVEEGGWMEVGMMARGTEAVEIVHDI
ncbi:Uncharacterized protein BP5553_09556 [Venustampulla echinocandica]|uniref:DAGKc domain-containing protein n=1 Tax=Venustampulla echinocandica TaxID=2656787 RepID=A0A370TBD4_9HELO|nr:Uncharacterized protein BP5553_09556 [Venustampulla echinocandica]RDL31347.1 Uncharacterized protein BP5553_09556 [Venustampulla echinocandica]